MIVWLASYPKSGNTFVRSLLSSYIFSKDGNFNFDLLKNIKQFPDNSLFKQLGIDTNDEVEMFKNYTNAQKIFNKKDSIRFLKTHSCFFNNKKFQFTDRHNTLGVIYIVRDPRNIVTSYAHHFQTTPEQAFENLLSNLPKEIDHKIIIFGCGGDRDKTKRAKMAKIASKYTDIQIITDDNPRNENPSDIRKILIKFSSNPLEIPSRKKAIERGVRLLKINKGLLIIAGKGHENNQIYKNKIFTFNDRLVAKSYAKYI